MPKIRAIKGDWMVNGYLAGHDILSVAFDAAGKMWDADPCAGPLTQYYLHQYGNDCPVITNGCWTFAPDESELTRLGLVPKQMISTT